MKIAALLITMACLAISPVYAQNHSKPGKRFLQGTDNPSRSTSVFTYILTTLTEPYTDLTGATSINNGEIWDDPTYLFPIGFPFMLNGNEISSLQFFEDGYGGLLVSPTANPDILAILFPFESDLMDRGYITGVSMSPLSYKVEGSPGSRIQKIEWKNVGSYYEMDEFGTLNMFINFQLWLYEGSNKIEIHFGPSMINNPGTFYGGESGAYAGLFDYDLPNDVTINANIITGDADDPFLSDEPNPLVGTPSEEIVYRLSVNLPLEVEVTGLDGTSFCSPNGTATANASGGVEPYEYDWSNGGTTQTISDLDAGTYTVTVTDDTGSTATGSVTIDNADPIEVNATSTDETSVDANDGTASASPTGGSPPYEYSWSNGSNDPVITGLAPGIYTVTVTDDEGCSGEESVIVNEFGCPELLPEAAITNVVCHGQCSGSIDIIEVFQGTEPFTYDWSEGSNTPLITQLCMGDYTVTIVDATGCSVIETYSVTQPDELNTNAGSTDETAPNANDGTAWAAPTGGTPPYTYAWNGGQSDSLITGLAPGLYTVIVSDANACVDTQSVSVDSFGCYLVATVVNNSCFQSCDGSIEVNMLNAVDPITYQWSNGDTTALLSDLCAGIYDVTATDAVGCTSFGTFTVFEPPPLVANAGSTNETAPGANDGTAWAAPFGGMPPYSYAWSNGSTDSLITSLTPDLYDVTITDASGCTDVQTVVVEHFPCQGSIESTSSNPSCNGFCDGSASVEVIGGIGPIVYQWSTGDTTSAIADICSGFYIVTITDQGQNCTAILVFQIDQPDSLRVHIDQVVHITDTTSASISITATGGTPPYTYQWTGPNGYSSTDEDISGIEEGSYSLVVTDANGCVTSSSSILINDETVSTSNLQIENLNMYPNPSKNQVVIKAEGLTDYKVQLQGMDGRILYTWTNEHILDIHQFSTGLYILKLIEGNNYRIGQLVIIK